MQSSRTETRIPELDGIRGIAMMMVLVHHLPIPKIIFVNYWMGVDIFFVLSGFLITSLLIEEDRRSGSIDLKSFWFRRALRLLPAVTIFLITYTVIMTMLFHDPVKTLKAVAAVQLYVANWAYLLRVDMPMIVHTWSLSVEEHFYILWPITISIALRRIKSYRHLCWFLAASILIVAIWRAWIFGNGHYKRCYFGTDTRADAILMGCLIAFLFYCNFRVSNALAALALLTIALPGLVPKWQRILLFPRGGDTIAAAAAGTLILWVMQYRRRSRTRILRVGWLRWTGQISYGLYLWHFFLITLAATLWPGSPMAPFIGAAVSLAVSAISFYMIEQPILEWSRIKFAREARATVAYGVQPVKAD